MRYTEEEEEEKEVEISWDGEGVIKTTGDVSESGTNATMYR
jgi:hypothetical protein